MNWFRVTTVDNIPLREGRAVRIGDDEIAIFNLGDRFVACENSCPHRGGPLADGLLGGTTLICPLHAWKFDASTGEVLFGECGLKVFPVRVDESGQIVLSLEKE